VIRYRFYSQRYEYIELSNVGLYTYSVPLVDAFDRQNEMRKSYDIFNFVLLTVCKWLQFLKKFSASENYTLRPILFS